MPNEFIKSKFNANNLAIATRQQRQLSYFTESKVQEDITIDYITKYANRKYRGDDYFLNFLKTVFRTDVFLNVFKFFRHPVASARLVHDKIRIPLGRVFFSEDPYFKYEINGEMIKHPEGLDDNEFNTWIFNALLFRHNDIMIVDLKDVNTPFKSLVPIDNVIALDSERSIINRIAYSAQIVQEGKIIIGVVYIDAERYQFYEKDKDGTISDTPTLDIPHDLGRCPADYISDEAFSESDVIRKSIFSYVREEMEEYVFLKTLQRMVEPSIGIPTSVMLKAGVKNKNPDGADQDGTKPMSSRTIENQKAEQTSTVQGNKSFLQAGSLIKVDVSKLRKEDGSIDMEVIKNYVNFFYAPVEATEYLNKRIKEIRVSIISNVVGDHSEGSVPEGSKSETEINSVTIVSKQDKLRDFSKQMSRIRTRSDYNWLSLKFGKENISNTAFYGSDFFLETQKDLYDLVKTAPNPIEQRSLLIKSARNRNRFNVDNFSRDKIFYHLIPYAANGDFDIAVEKEQIGEITFQYQTRFNYWIGLFEAEFGDILTFWNLLGDLSEAEKVKIINNLILTIIKDNYETSSLVKSV